MTHAEHGRGHAWACQRIVAHHNWGIFDWLAKRNLLQPSSTPCLVAGKSCSMHMHATPSQPRHPPLSAQIVRSLPASCIEHVQSICLTYGATCRVRGSRRCSAGNQLQTLTNDGAGSRRLSRLFRARAKGSFWKGSRAPAQLVDAVGPQAAWRTTWEVDSAYAGCPSLPSHVPRMRPLSLRSSSPATSVQSLRRVARTWCSMIKATWPRRVCS